MAVPCAVLAPGMHNTRKNLFLVLRIIRISIMLSINTDNTLGLQASYTKPTFTASRYNTGLHQVQYISTRSRLTQLLAGGMSVGRKGARTLSRRCKMMQPDYNLKSSYV